MIRLFVDCRMVNSSGIGTYLQSIVPRIFEHFSMTFLGDIELLQKFSFQKYGKLVKFLPPIYSLKEQIGYPFKVKKADLLWSPHYNIPIVPVRARKRVVTIHDLNHLVFVKNLSLKQKFYAKFMLQKAVSVSDSVITDSHFTYDELIKYTKVKKQKLNIISLGVDTDLFAKVENRNVISKVRKRYSLPEKYILYVGNVKPHKNLTRLIEAFKIVLANGKDKVYLVIVGKKEGFLNRDTTLFSLLEGDKILKRRVYFTGFVQQEDLPALYSMARVFVFPSLYEGFGLPPLEAMACGCPCIVSNSSSIPEVCGNAALYVDPQDTDDLVTKIKKVLNDENQCIELVEKGYRRIMHFNWEETAKKHIKLFQEVLHN